MNGNSSFLSCLLSRTSQPKVNLFPGFLCPSPQIFYLACLFIMPPTHSLNLRRREVDPEIKATAGSELFVLKNIPMSREEACVQEARQMVEGSSRLACQPFPLLGLVPPPWLSVRIQDSKVVDIFCFLWKLKLVELPPLTFLSPHSYLLSLLCPWEGNDCEEAPGSSVGWGCPWKSCCFKALWVELVAQEACPLEGVSFKSELFAVRTETGTARS